MFIRALALSSILLLTTACGGPSSVGGSCDPTDAESCETGLVCDVDETCRKTAGAMCDPAASEEECEQGRTCIGDGATGTCSLMEGDPCEPADSDCPDDLICAELAAGDHACYPPVLLVGTVSSTENGSAVAGAHVIAMDELKMPVTDVAITDAAGDYELGIPVVRDASGVPTGAKFTLRAGAADFQTFPAGIRQALPIEAVDAVEEDRGWVIDTALTDITLIPLATTGLARITGEVNAGDASGGVLVVAEQVDGASGAVIEGSGVSALTDLAGDFTIFNVPDGDYTLRGFRADLQLTPEEVTVAGDDLTGVVLGTSADPTAELSGNVIVNSPGEASGLTSVVLLLKSTFDPVYVRGEVPPGLRAPRFGEPDVSGAFTLTGVPDGEYVVLAGFENDGLVRDESDGGNTAIVEVTVPDALTDRTITLASGFKLTGDLAIVGPGVDGPEAVTDPPTFTWVDGANEDHYELVVLNAMGELVWEDLAVPKVTGEVNATMAYAGPALEAGMYYQFRVAAIDNGGAVAARTEDLRGVFYLAQ